MLTAFCCALQGIHQPLLVTALARVQRTAPPVLVGTAGGFVYSCNLCSAHSEWALVLAKCRLLTNQSGLQPHQSRWANAPTLCCQSML